MELISALGGAGAGIILGWLAPIAGLGRWQSLVASGAIIAVAAGTLYLLGGVLGVIGGAVGVVAGAWLHGMFLEHVARMATTREV